MTRPHRAGGHRRSPPTASARSRRRRRRAPALEWKPSSTSTASGHDRPLAPSTAPSCSASPEALMEDHGHEQPAAATLAAVLEDDRGELLAGSPSGRPRAARRRRLPPPAASASSGRARPDRRCTASRHRSRLAGGAPDAPVGAAVEHPSGRSRTSQPWQKGQWKTEPPQRSSIPGSAGRRYSMPVASSTLRVRLARRRPARGRSRRRGARRSRPRPRAARRSGRPRAPRACRVEGVRRAAVLTEQAADPLSGAVALLAGVDDQRPLARPSQHERGAQAGGAATDDDAVPVS